MRARLRRRRRLAHLEAVDDAEQGRRKDKPLGIASRPEMRRQGLRHMPPSPAEGASSGGVRTLAGSPRVDMGALNQLCCSLFLPFGASDRVCVR